MSQNLGIAGAILGVGNLAATYAQNRAGAYESLNQIALHHALNSASMQQQHENTLAQIGYKHGLDRQAASEGYSHALDVIHQQGDVNRKNATHENNLAMKMESHKAELGTQARNAADESWKNRASFALTNQKQFAPGSSVKIHEHGLDFSTPPAPEKGAVNEVASKNRINARMKAGRGRA